jgi:hypothetical protein
MYDGEQGLSFPKFSPFPPGIISTLRRATVLAKANSNSSQKVSNSLTVSVDCIVLSEPSAVSLADNSSVTCRGLSLHSGHLSRLSLAYLKSNEINASHVIWPCCFSGPRFSQTELINECCHLLGHSAVQCVRERTFRRNISLPSSGSEISLARIQRVAGG